MGTTPALNRLGGQDGLRSNGSPANAGLASEIV
jgi:hypothetical protein